MPKGKANKRYKPDALLGVLVPLGVYRSAARRTIVERLREAEQGGGRLSHALLDCGQGRRWRRFLPSSGMACSSAGKQDVGSCCSLPGGKRPPCL